MCTLDQARDSLHLSVCSMVVYIYIYQSCSSRRWLSYHSSSMFHSIHGSVVGIIQIAAAGNSVSIFLDKFVVICCLVVVVVLSMWLLQVGTLPVHHCMLLARLFQSVCLLHTWNLQMLWTLNLKPYHHSFLLMLCVNLLLWLYVVCRSLFTIRSSWCSPPSVDAWLYVACKSLVTIHSSWCFVLCWSVACCISELCR